MSTALEKIGKFLSSLHGPISPDQKSINPTIGPISMSMTANLLSAGSSSGVYVTEMSALGLPTVWACTQVLSQTISSLPLGLFQKTPQGKFLDEKNSINKLITLRPNPEMTAVQWRATMMCHLALWGNHYAYIEFNNAGKPKNIWPIEPWRVYVRRVNGELVYDVVLIAGGIKRLLPYEMLHFKGLATNGIVGLSPIRAHCEAIGIGLASQVSSGKFYSNDSVPSGILGTEQKLDDNTRKRLRSAWEEGHKGLDNHHRIAIIDAGMKFQQLTINPVDAQLIETRKLTREEIASIYRIPQHKVGILERSTNNNIEQQGIEFGTDTIKPWTINIEQELNVKLLPESEWGQKYFRHDLSDMMRGDSVAQAQFYGAGRQWGWYSADDVREQLNLNDLPDGLGKIYLCPANMTQLGVQPAPIKPGKPEQGE